MGDARTVAENGSFRLVEQEGRFAVVEVRDGRLYALASDGGERASAPDRPDAVCGVVGPADWRPEDEARRRFEDLARDGDRLARTIW